MNEHPTPDEVEARAVTLAVGLLVAIADPKAAKQRIEDLVAATEAHDLKLAEAAAALEALDEKQALFQKADAALATRVEQFQAWTSNTEAAFRLREGRIVENEQLAEARDRQLADRESDLAKRASAHEARVAALRANRG